MSKRKNKFTKVQRSNRKGLTVRQDFYRRLLYIALSATLLYFLRKESGPLRFIGAAGVLIILYNFIIVIRGIQSIIDDFFPPKTYFPPEGATPQILPKVAGGLFFAGLAFNLFEFDNLDKTIGGSVLFFNWALIGLGIAVAVNFLLYRIWPVLYSASTSRITLLLGFCLGFSILMPPSASMANRLWAEPLITCKNHKLLRKSLGGKRDNLPLIFIKTPYDDDERFEVTMRFYERISEGQQLQFCTQKGLLGYDVVKKIK